MSSFKRRIFLCLVGCIAGLASWPAAETAMLYQEGFPSYLTFSVFLGGVFGLFMGAFFGSGDGIIMSHMRNLVKGVIQGMIIGAVGGIMGFLAGQGALFITGEYLIHSMKKFNTLGLPLSRALGWAVLGIFVGMVDGVRSGSLNKVRVGILGGISGGLLGGLALEYLRMMYPGMISARLIGLIIFGFCIGLLYGFVEVRLSYGVLTLLNGRQKGREFLISQKKLKVGFSRKNDIVLSDYRNIDDFHAEVRIKKDEVLISPSEKGTKPVYVNDDTVRDHMLKYEDVIKIGSAKLLYQFK